MAQEDKWSKQYVNNLFARAGLDREGFANINKSGIPMGIEGLVLPLTMPGEVADPNLKTALYEIGRGNVRANIKLFPMEKLLTVLELEKDVAPVRVAADPRLLASLAPNAVGGRGAGRGGRGRGRGRGRGAGRGAEPEQQLAGLSAFSDVNAAAAEALTAGSKKRKHADEEYVPPRPVVKPNPAAASSSAAAVAANRNINFYPTISTLFEKFWNLEFNSPAVSAAFFAQITMYNCHDYQLDAYAEEACCLPVIKEKIDRRLYRTTDEFVLDFRTMCENTIQFYPKGSEASAKAKELLAEFTELWVVEKKKLYGV